jgi:hypothetical protein
MCCWRLTREQQLPSALQSIDEQPIMSIGVLTAKEEGGGGPKRRRKTK